MPDLPLAGVKILEVSVWHAGPGAAAILADLGAEVVKVESLDGDPERSFGHLGNPHDLPNPDKPNWTRLFEMSNRGKKSVALDISDPSGHAALLRIAADVDVFLTNLRSSTVSKLRIDHESISAVNENVVHVAVNGYGARGPMADVGGFDPLGQAMSGMMYMTNGEEPVLLDVVPLDQLTAITTSHAILTSLYARKVTGKGDSVNVSLYGSGLWLQYVNLFAASLLPGGARNYLPRSQTSVLHATYKCSDGEWILACNNPEEKYWKTFCSSLGLPGLAEEPALSTRQQRSDRNLELLTLFDAEFAKHPAEYWLDKLQGDGLLFAPIRTISEVLDDQQAWENEYLKKFDHPSLGRITVPGHPATFGRYPHIGFQAPAPALGEHTTDILLAAGYSGADAADLIAAQSKQKTS